jgi:N-acetylneuraminic acid mutarotase
VYGGCGTTSFSCYDPVSDSWASLAVPQAHRFPAAGVINGKLYLAGGDAGPFASPFLDVFDPATGTWAAKAPMPTGRKAPTGSVIAGKFYVVGGVSNTGGYFAANEAYDPATDSWTTLASVSTALQGMTSGPINGILYTAGGYANGFYFQVVQAYTP